MSTSGTDEATRVARDYYNSSDADTFYHEVWGGEDIHVGMYASVDEPIRVASRRTVDHMASQLGAIHEDATILDIGAGYGGAARRLVEETGCRVVCLNLSDAENERNRAMNEAQGYADRIDVIQGSFEEIPLGDESVDGVWCQDAILHSGDRARVFDEVDRVLKKGGRFIFTDPMKSDNCPDGVLDPILARIHLPDLGSPGFYKSQGERLGWTDLGFEDMTPNLVKHYKAVLRTTESEADQLKGKISDEYLERMKSGLRHWIDAGRAANLSWGLFLFEKS